MAERLNASTPKPLGEYMMDDLINNWEKIDAQRRKDLETLKNWLDEYGKKEMSENDIRAKINTFYDKEVLLSPFNRYGNILAVAFAMGEFDIAKAIVAIKGIQTDRIASEEGGRKSISVMDYIDELKPHCDEKNRKKLDEIAIIVAKIRDDREGR